MDRPFLVVLLGFAVASMAALAQTLPPRLLGVPAPAAAAVPVPEATRLDALSSDGRWLLFTSASDRWTANDLNAAADVFLFDRSVGTIALVSAGTEGRPGNGTSVAGGLSEEASRAVFLSRASNLTTNETNATWDVFVRDLAAGTNALVSQAGNGGSSTGPASAPLISADGRFVLFRSPAHDLVAGPALVPYNLYRRDLSAAQTRCVTTALPPGFPGVSRLTSFAATPDLQALVWVIAATESAVMWQDLASGATTNCSGLLPPELAGATEHAAPAISGNGARVAFRSNRALGAGMVRYGLTLRDVGQGTVTLLGLRTNFTASQVVPDNAFNAALNFDGAAVAYTAPWPGNPTVPPPARTNGPSQVYLYDVLTGATRLVSAGPDGTTPANVDAVDVRLTPDGRGVVFASRATNLVAAATTESQRIYWWTRETGVLEIVADLGADDHAGQFVMSPGGEWIAALATDAEDGPTVHYSQPGNAASESVRLTPVVQQSATARGWFDVQPAGVSADGRYVAISAFPPEPAGGTNHMQIYRLDTHSGARELVTLGADGALANRHTVPPSLSADGSRLLFYSPATNLLADDRNGVADVFVQDVATGERRMLRGLPLPSAAVAQPDCRISPDGGTAFVTFLEGTVTASRVASLTSPIIAGTFDGVAQGLPSFSQDGRRLAVSLGSTTPLGANPRIEIHDPAAWLAGGGNRVPALWTSAVQAVEPIVNADGSRVAYFHISAAGTNAVVVMDWAKNRRVFTQFFGKQVPSSLGLSADGRFAVWVAPGLALGSLSQAWRADLDSGTVTLVSVGVDGASEGNGNTKSAVLSADGRYVAFASLADNLATGDTNGAKDVFLRDMQTGQTLLISRGLAGAPGAGWSLRPFWSGDGRSLFFLSHAPDLAIGDYNQAADLFKLEIVSDSGLLVVIQRDLMTGQVQLLWNGAPGKSYRVEFKDELAAATDWTRLPGEFTGTSAVPVNSAASERRFFRVAEEP